MRSNEADSSKTESQQINLTNETHDSQDIQLWTEELNQLKNAKPSKILFNLLGALIGLELYLTFFILKNLVTGQMLPDAEVIRGLCITLTYILIYWKMIGGKNWARILYLCLSSILIIFIWWNGILIESVTTLFIEFNFYSIKVFSMTAALLLAFSWSSPWFRRGEVLRKVIK